ncbi:RICIN domain-containing protein [Streptomyces sp. NPDC005551]|uniref:RICIN domain-containing protein n=1 Tax=Streptomyces sp. NPDC005551 TaxID=3364725 RepID=UPI0036CD177B
MRVRRSMTVAAGRAAACPSRRWWRRAAVTAAAVCAALGGVLGTATSAPAEVSGGTGEIRNAGSGRHIGTYGNYGQVLAAFTDANWSASSDRSWTFTPREHGRYYSIRSTTKGTCWTRSPKPAAGGDWDRYGPQVVTLAPCSPNATNQQFQLRSEPYPAPHGTVSIHPRDDISTVLRQTTPLGDGGTWNALSLEEPQHTNDELWTVPVTPNVGW